MDGRMKFCAKEAHGSGWDVEQAKQEQQEAAQLLPLYHHVPGRVSAGMVCGDGTVGDGNSPHGRDHDARFRGQLHVHGHNRGQVRKRA